MLKIPKDAPAELHCWIDALGAEQPLRSDVVVAKGRFETLARELIAIDPAGCEGDWSIVVAQRRLTHAEISEWIRREAPRDPRTLRSRH